MRKYLSFFRIRFLSGLQYRAAAWAGVSTQFAWGGMSILMYRAFYRVNAEAFPMEFADLTTYIWLQQALLAMFMAWYFDNDIFDSISSGAIAYELCRPCDLYTMWFTKNVAVRLSRVVLRCFPILLVAVFLPRPYGVSLPESVAAGLLFPLSLILGFLVLVAFSMLIYISAFYTISSTGVRILATSAVEFLTGGVIPLPFFPGWLQPIMNALPFASMQNTPFLIYTGHVNGQEAMRAILLQAVWLVVLVGVGKIWIRHATRRVVLQGG
ncbi:MAG: ABC-2 family transporter protein [Clostridia bacterium]|nr:ABC-2 family transporter protein [Clostridia bacterium]